MDVSINTNTKKRGLRSGLRVTFADQLISYRFFYKHKPDLITEEAFLSESLYNTDSNNNNSNNNISISNNNNDSDDYYSYTPKVNDLVLYNDNFLVPQIAFILDNSGHIYNKISRNFVTNCNFILPKSVKNNKPRFIVLNNNNNNTSFINNTSSYAVCTFPGCTDTAGYDYINSSGMLFCKKHSIKSYLIPNFCQHYNCREFPVYGFEGERATRCFNHILFGMESVLYNKCHIDGCKEEPQSINFKSRVFCKLHAFDYMKKLQTL